MTAFSGLRIFDFDELFGADESLRGQARKIREAAGELTVGGAGLPPEAQGIIAGLTGLRGQLDRAADTLTTAATALGQTGADARRADTPGLLDYLKAALVLASGEAPEALLRYQGRRRIAKLRGALRRNTRLLQAVDRQRDAARAAGDWARVKQLDREHRIRRKLRDKSFKDLRQTRQDVRSLREAGYIKGWDERTLRALKELSGALGYKVSGGILSAREWHRAMRNAGSLPKALGQRVFDRHAGRQVPAGRGTPKLRRFSPERAGKADDLARRTSRLLDNPAARRVGGAIPVAGVGVDVVSTGLAAKKFADHPNLGNGVDLVANGAHLIGNIPTPPTIIGGEAVGYGLDGAKLVGDHVDDVDVTPWDGLAPW